MAHSSYTLMELRALELLATRGGDLGARAQSELLRQYGEPASPVQKASSSDDDDDDSGKGRGKPSPAPGKASGEASNAANDASSHASIVDRHGDPGAKAQAHSDAANAHVAAANAHQAAAASHAAQAQSHADTAIANASRQTNGKVRTAASHAAHAAAGVQADAHKPASDPSDSSDDVKQTGSPPTKEDATVTALLRQVLSDMEATLAAQKNDPDATTDPQDLEVWAHLEDARAILQNALVNQQADDKGEADKLDATAKPEATDASGDDDKTDDETDDKKRSTTKLARIGTLRRA